MQRVYDNGYVYKGLYEGWYCPRCADFKVENEILEGNLCPIHEIPLTRESEENWFFKLSALPGAARAALRGAAATSSCRRGRCNEAQAFLEQGLQDVSLSRAKLTWGVTVPWDPSHVFYVWFDALLNYYTALSYARPGEDLTDRYWPAPAARDRQGHPQVPRDLLAGDAAGRRPARRPSTSSCTAS